MATATSSLNIGVIGLGNRNGLAACAHQPDTALSPNLPTSPKLKEEDLYPPIKVYLESQGYEVKGEIGDCDVMALRSGEEPVVVELKLKFNLSVILQAVDRYAVAEYVYIGVPADCKALQTRQKKVLKLLRMLGLGLITVDPLNPKMPVTVLFDPSEYRPRRQKKRQQRLLGEFAARVGDTTPGGSARRKGVMTAYRQRALKIAAYLQTNGPTKAATVATAVAEPKARQIMYGNVYGWFDRAEKGVYKLSSRGAKEMPLWCGK
jgi:hypothetical protein